MKNRRLNVLFIAIIALAAAPQALLDVHRLANAAQERIETEFWSVFLSYQTPAANGTEKRAATELVTARRQRETKSDCTLEQRAEPPVEVARNVQANESSLRARAVKQEGRRASAKANSVSPVTVEADMDGDDETEEVALATMREAAFSEKEQPALKSTGLHARDTEKLADILTIATLAPSFDRNKDLQIKVRQIEMDKLLRQKIRYLKDRSETRDEIPTPSLIEGM